MKLAPIALLSVGCAAVSGDVYEVCSLEARLEPEVAAVGETVTVTGAGPFSDVGVRDTRVEVGGVPATVVTVERNQACEECDACRAEAGCAPCGLCSGRLLDEPSRVACFGDPIASPPVEGVCAQCEESMSFEIPTGAPVGPTTVWIVTRDGSSDPIPFVVTGPGTTTGDTGGVHTGETGATPPTP